MFHAACDSGAFYQRPPRSRLALSSVAFAVFVAVQPTVVRTPPVGVGVVILPPAALPFASEVRRGYRESLNDED